MLEKKSSFRLKKTETNKKQQQQQFRFHSLEMWFFSDIIDTELFLNNVEFTIHWSFDFAGDGKLSYSEFIDLMKDRVQRGFQVR